MYRIFKRTLKMPLTLRVRPITITKPASTLNYRLMFFEILHSVELDKPKTMKAVSDILRDLSNQESFFGLLVGEIQSGKTPAQMILTWIFTRHPDFLGKVCFVTKCLDSIRRDIMSKFESDLINQHVIKIGEKHGLSRQDALKMFGLTYHIYTSTNTNNNSQGQVEVMLMQKDNFNYVRTWYNNIRDSAPNSPVLFLVDEMHEMYAGANDFFNNGGLTDATKIGNIGMLHWFNKKCSSDRCYLIGVTATPYAPMSADTICWPKRVYKLNSDAPAKGLTYYGYEDHVLSDNIDIKTYKTDSIVDMEAIQAIINKQRTILTNGNTEIPFVCITTHLRNEQHNSIADMILEMFGNRTNLLIFNQETNTSLSQWFNPRMLTREVCESGALVIVGRNSMAAGITVKPSKPLIAEWNGVKYQVTGITDQFMPKTPINLTSTKQLMRILGWFPDGHQASLWVHKDELKPVYKSHIGHISRQFMNNYDIIEGPESVREMLLVQEAAKHIKNFYASDPYGVTSPCGLHLTSKDAPPPDMIKMETTWTRVGEIPELEDRTINSFFHGKSEAYKNAPNEQHTLRKMLQDRATVSHFQIGYEQKRYDDIMKCALKPGSTVQWRVNSFLWGANGPQTPIKDCYIITFTNKWDQRPHDGNVAFKTPDNRWYFMQTNKQRTNKHDSLDLTKLHYHILKSMDTPAKKLPIKMRPRPTTFM